jgi:8-hydroxy-5-deazaflavin:NADPH oxidoreductase
MQVGIIGAGQIGGTVAGLLAAAGYEVALSNSRGRESLLDLARRLGPKTIAATPDEAAEFAEIAVVATPFYAVVDLPRRQLADTTVVDATNYFPDRDSGFEDLAQGARTSSEVVAEHLDQSVVVKAINTLNYALLADRPRPGGSPARLALPYAGNDREAKHRVGQMIDDMGFDPVDAGSLASGARLMQPGGELFNRPLTAAGVRAALEGSTTT